jgi:cob(I)alamin adenosyltransferase
MSRERLTQGFIQVYTGDGKGKTTCALGLALRAVGRGLKVFMVQWLKTGDTGEVLAAARLAPELTIRSLGRPGFINFKSPAPKDIALAREALDLAKEAIAGGEYDLVILDEINVALAFGLLDLEEVLAMLRSRPPWVEVVLTGRQAPAELVALADLVTEMRSVKHYYEAGVTARKGIEW